MTIVNTIETVSMCQPIKLQIHLWTNRKRLSSVEYASACCGSGAYTSRCTLHLSYMTDCRMLLTFVLRSKLWSGVAFISSSRNAYDSTKSKPTPDIAYSKFPKSSWLTLPLERSEYRNTGIVSFSVSSPLQSGIGIPTSTSVRYRWTRTIPVVPSYGAPWKRVVVTP
jgi:hypothetical protein